MKQVLYVPYEVFRSFHDSPNATHVSDTEVVLRCYNLEWHRWYHSELRQTMPEGAPVQYELHIRPTVGPVRGMYEPVHSN